MSNIKDHTRKRYREAHERVLLGDRVTLGFRDENDRGKDWALLHIHTKCAVAELRRGLS